MISYCMSGTNKGTFQVSFAYIVSLNYHNYPHALIAQKEYIMESVFAPMIFPPMTSLISKETTSLFLLVTFHAYFSFMVMDFSSNTQFTRA